LAQAVRQFHPDRRADHHGDSGGPTFNRGRSGRRQSAIYSPNDVNVGIGFAILADTVHSVFTPLKEKGYVTRGALDLRVHGSGGAFAVVAGLLFVNKVGPARLPGWRLRPISAG
jgi:S1-C subfamily serine protease